MGKGHQMEGVDSDLTEPGLNAKPTQSGCRLAHRNMRVPFGYSRYTGGEKKHREEKHRRTAISPQMV